MSSGISHAASVFDTERLLLAGLSGLKVLDMPGGPVVVAAAAGEGGLTRLALDPATGALSVIDQQEGAGTAHDLVEWGAGVALLDRYSAGGFARETGGIGASGLPGALEVAAASADGAAQAWAAAGQGGVTISVGGAVHFVADTGALTLGDVRALSVDHAGGVAHVVAGGGRDSGLTVLRADAHGVEVIGALPPSGTFAHYQVSALSRVEVGAESFVIAGAAASGSLSVFRVAAEGALIQTDHLFDGRDSRFAGVDQVVAEVIDGRVIVAAGGADRGVTLFEMDAAGALHVLASVVDTQALALDDLAGLALVPGAVSGTAFLVTAATRDAGISVLTLDLPALQPGTPVARPETGPEVLMPEAVAMAAIAPLEAPPGRVSDARWQEDAFDFLEGPAVAPMALALGPDILSAGLAPSAPARAEAEMEMDRTAADLMDGFDWL